MPHLATTFRGKKEPFLLSCKNEALFKKNYALFEKNYALFEKNYAPF
jgi:hypothetical protein